MDRRALEALSSAELHRLIAEATAVLAERRTSAKFKEIEKEWKSELKNETQRETCPAVHGRGTKRGLDASEESEEAEDSRLPGSGSVTAPDLAPPLQRSVSGKRVMVIASKRSGVKGVRWKKKLNGWQVSWRKDGQRKQKLFAVHRYEEQQLGGSYEEADAQALRDAVAFREGLVRQGVVEEARAERQSGCPGVSWHRTSKRWMVRMKISGKDKTFGYFHPKDDTPEEVERARLAAVERRREVEAEHREVVVREDVQACNVEMQESGVPGITWRRFSHCWQAHILMLGKNVAKRFTPKDLSPEAIETALLLAIQWRRDMEHRKASEVDR